MLDIPTARALLASSRPHPSCKGYPADVRDEVTKLARDLLAHGRRPDRIARDLGLHGETLGSWLEGPMAPAVSFIPVVLSPEGPTSTPGTVTLVSPSGYRLEGLDVDRAIAAFARLR